MDMCLLHRASQRQFTRGLQVEQEGGVGRRRDGKTMSENGQAERVV